MRFARAAGVLAHPTSFPGAHGIGDLGEWAFRFIDWLSTGRQSYWQIMPLVPVGSGNSPYSSISAFAGNPLLISIPWLAGDGLLTNAELGLTEKFDPSRADFAAATKFKTRLLRTANKRFQSDASADQRREYDAFCDVEASWCEDFALFVALKQHFDEKAWTQWEPSIARHDQEACARWRGQLFDEFDFHRFVQFQFHRQWRELRRYANERGIQIIGDIPIFVAHDSADVWANQSQFRLDRAGNPAVIAGVPPDYFSKTGQLWGNPHYDWPAMAASGFDWWIARFRRLLDLVDVVRIDHFRGFAAAWTVPAGDQTASGGRWEKGPGRALFDAV